MIKAAGMDTWMLWNENGDGEFTVVLRKGRGRVYDDDFDMGRG